MNRRHLFCLALILSPATAMPGPSPTAQVTVGSKKFTESVIMGELVAQLGRSAHDRVNHRRELGGTRILWEALLRGDIDIYPEYTGTISQEILSAPGVLGEESLGQALAVRGVGMSRPLGFSNTYAIGMKQEVAQRLGIRTISDLRNHPSLRFGFGEEFMDRADGWPGLRKRYALPQQARGMDHDLAYRGLQGGSIDVTDLYSTDAEIGYYHLRVLNDDLGYFPEYRAVLIYREDLKTRAPEFLQAVLQLEGLIPEDRMIAMNARCKLDKVPESRVVGKFLSTYLGVTSNAKETGASARLLQRTIEHLYLVAISLAAAIVVALPLGIFAAKRPAWGQVILAIAGVIQTIPSLALLVFMIPLLGIGAPAAIVALFLYSLLPIIRNTSTGLLDIPLPIRESAEALGLPPLARLWRIELPLASRAILGGIKTSAVINVGTATLGAIIGAGGYGQPILTGIRLDNTSLILQGAVPAAVLTLLVQGGFEVLGCFIVPKGLRLPHAPRRGPRWFTGRRRVFSPLAPSQAPADRPAAEASSR